MVLVFSKQTGRSPHVRREIERAVHRDIAIVPLRVDNIMPEGDLEFFLSSQHWIDLFPGPMANHLPRIQSTVRSLVGIKTDPSARAAKTSPSPTPQPKGPPRPATETPRVEKPAANPPATKSPPPPAPAKASTSRKWIAISAIAAGVVIIALAAAFAIFHSPSKDVDHETPGKETRVSPAPSPSPTPSPTPNLSLDAAKSADTIDKAKSALPAIDRALKADSSNAQLQSLSQRLHAMSDPDAVLKSLKIELVRIEPAEFDMGSPSSETDRRADELQHHVAISKTYYLARTEVTQGQWYKVMNESFEDHSAKAGKAGDAVGEGDDKPMYFVSWDDAREFCGKLGALTGQHVRLPTEEEWEFACRAVPTRPIPSATGRDTRRLRLVWRQLRQIKARSPQDRGNR